MDSTCLRIMKLTATSSSEGIHRFIKERSKKVELSPFWSMASSSLLLFPSLLKNPNNKTSDPPSISFPRRSSAVRSSLSAQPFVAAPDDLVSSILYKVKGTDRGVLLSKNGHKEVAEVARKLQNYCVGEPVKCPLIFGEWDVLYCSVPTSPGGGYRSSFGRLFLNAKEMVQVVESPNIVLNKVSFSLLGFLDAEVSLKGKLKALDEKWIQVIFEPPEVKIGSLGLKYGGESEVKLEITYIDERIRLGMGSKGSLFVFLRRGQ